MRIVITSTTLKATPRRLTRRSEIPSGGNDGKRSVLRGATSGRSWRKSSARAWNPLATFRKPVDRMKLVRSAEKNLPLYYLALFSRSEMAFNFWDDVLKYSDDQESFRF